MGKTVSGQGFVVGAGLGVLLIVRGLIEFLT